MENSPNQQTDLEIAQLNEDTGSRQLNEDPGSRQLKGIRLRKWGRWVSKIRIPKTREKIWLGSYTTPEQAARAYDAAVYCLKGPNAKFNFPESVRDIPCVTSVSRQQIQHAALKYALGQPPPSLQSLEGHASPSQASMVSEMPLSGEEQKISEECPDLGLWWSLFVASDDTGIPSSENFPSIDEDFIPTLQDQREDGYISTNLWNFQDQDV